MGTDAAARLVVRRLKREVTLSGGKRFREPDIRVISTVKDATAAERALNPLLDAYVDHLREREQALLSEDERAKAKGCSFLTSVLLKRTGSSVAALRATLRRRLGLPPADEDHDEAVGLVDSDASDPEDDEIDPGAAQLTPPPELGQGEEELARALLEQAERVLPGRDAKLERLSELLSSELADRKVVVFTEYRDTLRAARRRFQSDGVSYVTFHGGTPDKDRRDALWRFQHDPDVRVFLATDAGSEGQNLQHSCHDLVHLDVPWNPNRYEQRNGRIDRYGQAERPRIWALVAADRRHGQGRPEFRALELVLEKLTRIGNELGSVGPVLPAISGDRVRDLLTREGERAEERVEEMMDDEAQSTAARQFDRLTARNHAEIEQATALVSELGTIDDFQDRVEALLIPAFAGWGDGGRIDTAEPGIVRIEVPRRLRRLLGRAQIDRATYRRDVAVREAEEERAEPAELLSPGHPLVEAVAQAIRERSLAVDFEHRFEVAADSRPALICSFLARYGDGEGRTVEERLEAVAVALDGSVSHDDAEDLRRLALDGQPGDLGLEARPDPDAIHAWQVSYSHVLPIARAEAHDRALGRLLELNDAARRIHDEEVAALALWRRDAEERIDVETLGIGGQLTLEAGAAHAERRRALEEAYERRLDALRDQSTIDLASLELIGGLVLVEPERDR